MKKQKVFINIQTVDVIDEILEQIDTIIDQVEEAKAIMRTQQILNERMLEIMSEITGEE